MRFRHTAYSRKKPGVIIAWLRLFCWGFIQVRGGGTGRTQAW
ncbi:unknown protein [Cronobacter turicensis z3032]|uniref:Uncharacterized protein n=1 Tax=Cronobacter turicensis (strain DSM 18703 / CCUG 55852 / LMG 23827 / z3032) TaxID=693216 RepID=C9XVL6_CROTZ|nr:unknown protein [Cronobacter turicensis z3032]